MYVYDSGRRVLNYELLGTERARAVLTSDKNYPKREQRAGGAARAQSQAGAREPGYGFILLQISNIDVTGTEREGL